jgi:long-subunit acyl-CoA synthetase (AMP-forming)
MIETGAARQPLTSARQSCTATTANYLVALLALDGDESVKLAERLGIATDPATIATHPGVCAELETEVERVNQKFARIEQIKRFAILEHDLSQAGGELTPTLKVKRAVVYETVRGRVRRVVAGTYGSGRRLTARLRRSGRVREGLPWP